MSELGGECPPLEDCNELTRLFDAPLDSFPANSLPETCPENLLPEQMTLLADAVELAEEIDASMFCTITFLLNPSLSVSALEFVFDDVTWPAVLEVRVSVKDVILDIKTFEAVNRRPRRSY
ncbi:hypothetical protein FRC09_015049 [Ceratobasidium sp. 395]|nr:hypothetical protein FRC09_015049 [Ceratobasidium sp. 395]